MYQKPKLLSFDLVAGMILLSLLTVLWSTVRALSLVQAEDFSLNIKPPSKSAAATIPQPDKEALLQQNKDELASALDQVLAKFVKAEPNDFGIYIKHLPSGVVSQSAGDEQFITASMYKPFAAIDTLKLVDKGQLSLSQVIAEDGRTVEQCVWDAITVSDNPCGHALLNVSGLATNQGLSRLKADGFDSTDMRSEYPVSTAADVAKLFQHLYEADLLKPASNRLLLDALKNQKVNNRLPLGLPDDVKLAHKTGDLEGYAHDGGIVYSQITGDYLIVVMSGPDSSRLLDTRYARFGDLTKSIHQVMVKYGPSVFESS